MLLEVALERALLRRTLEEHARAPRRALAVELRGRGRGPLGTERLKLLPLLFDLPKF